MYDGDGKCEQDYNTKLQRNEMSWEMEVWVGKQY